MHMVLTIWSCLVFGRNDRVYTIVEQIDPMGGGISIYRNGPERTGTDRNGPEWTQKIAKQTVSSPVLSI